MIRFICILFVLFLFVFNCNPVNPSQSDNYVQLDTTSGNILAKIGDTFEIRILNGSSDGGYWWYVTTEFDSTIARLVTFKTEPSSDAVGAPTYEIWLYNAIKQGNDTLRLKLYRSWDSMNIIATKSFNLTVQP